MGETKRVPDDAPEEEALHFRRRPVIIRIVKQEGQALTRVIHRQRQEEDEEIAVPHDQIGSYFF